MGERKGRVKSRNVYKGPMVKDNRVGVTFGSEGGRGRGEQWWVGGQEEWGQR